MSNLLDPDHPPPSPETAERIVMALPVEPEVRYGLLEHMLLAREEAARVTRYIRSEAASEATVPIAYNALRDTYGRSVLLSTQSNPAPRIVTVRDAGVALLRALNPRTAPLPFVETCLMVHLAQCALNRWDDALFLTQLAEAILQRVEPSDVRNQRDWFEHLQVNVAYATSMSYRNLNLPKLAQRSIEHALRRAHDAPAAVRTFWLPSLFREKMEIYWRLPRFAFADVESLGDQIRAFVQQRGEGGSLDLLTDRTLINACIRYDSPRSRRRAEARLRQWMDRLDGLPGGGLARAMFLRTAARYYDWIGQHDAWESVADSLIQLATHEDLRHQLSEFEREFPNSVARLRR